MVRVPRRGQNAARVGSRLAAVAKSSDWGQGSISGPRSHEALRKLITISEQPFLKPPKGLAQRKCRVSYVLWEDLSNIPMESGWRRQGRRQEWRGESRALLRKSKSPNAGSSVCPASGGAQSDNDSPYIVLTSGLASGQ